MNEVIETVGSLIEAQRTKFLAVASKEINFDKEASFAMQILDANDYLKQVALQNKPSIIAAINNVAAIGISLNPAQKLAYLVPRKVNKVLAVCLDISYMGLLHIAQTSGAIFWGRAEVVYENDTFALRNIDQAPDHHFNPFSKDRGEIIGCYCVIKSCEGDFLTHSMTIDEIFAIRDRSESWKNRKAKESKGEWVPQSPWASDEKEMIRKTVIKQGSKYWPRRERLDGAIHYLNDVSNEGIKFETEKEVKEAYGSVVNDTLGTLSTDEQANVQAVSVQIMELLDECMDWEAYDLYVEETKDSEIKEAVWAVLGNNKMKVNGKPILYRSILTKYKKADENGEHPEPGSENGD